MDEQIGLRCYHHANCEDRPAVAKCSKCGKGLCVECADTLRSEDTGKPLCVECRNGELAKSAAWAENVRRDMKRELIIIIIGLVIGIVLEIVLGVLSENSETFQLLFFLSFVFFVPTLFSSLRSIFLWHRAVMRRVRQFPLLGLILVILLYLPFFLVFCAVSPIIFVVRVIRRVRKMKLMKRHEELQELIQAANIEYAEAARKMSTRISTEQFEREMRMKYSMLLKQNEKEYEEKLKEERAKFAKGQEEMRSATEKMKRALAAQEEQQRIRSDAVFQFESVRKHDEANRRTYDEVA